MTRAELAKHLYVNAFDPETTTRQERDLYARAWDAGRVADADVADCYGRADRMIAEGATR